ncbi:MAG: type I DNA topoisomerase [Armatimonadota bacterium]
MAKSLIIVESPAKARTITRLLANKYKVIASMGHIKDLPKSRLGVDIENNFEPQYINIKGKGTLIKQIKAEGKKHKTIFLAPDPDREGEAIAFHLKQILDKHETQRIYLHEITAPALKEALKNPTDINMNKVDAQQARRVLDRLVGYKLSPLLWEKVQRGLSAGRVQSVAVKLICDREREIEGFTSVEYWTVTGHFTPEDKEHPFKAELAQINNEKISIPNQEEVGKIVEDLKVKTFHIDKLTQKDQNKNPSPPFITSTLQQEASRKLGFRVYRTMKTAQQLYEGLDIGPHTSVGLITYMRTDSVNLSQTAKDQAKTYIKEKYGAEYVGPDRKFKSRKSAQEAHEAIRPTDVNRSPEEIKQFLTDDQYKIYKLIWQRFLASQMASCILDVKTVEIKADQYLFRASGQKVKFPGFTALYEESTDDEEKNGDKEEIPDLKQGEKTDLVKIEPVQHFTQPPPRYNEATLIKILEEKGIGRPSTYAPIIETIQAREYVLLDNKRFSPTKIGFIITDLLTENFAEIMDIGFTATMEENLDKVEEGDTHWIEIIKSFYQKFEETLNKAHDSIKKIIMEPEVTDQECPKCGALMVIKMSRFGKFLACSKYPECKSTKSFAQEIGIPCPNNCGGQVITKRTKKSTFYGCSSYPKCNFMSWYRPTDKNCPRCGKVMVLKPSKSKKFYMTCIDPECGKKAKEENEQAEE